MTDTNPILDAHLDLLIHKLDWSDAISEEVRSLAIGNIRGAVGRLIEDGVLVPADEIDRRVIEAVDGARSIKAARTSASEEDGTSLQNLQRTYALADRPGALIEASIAAHGHGHVLPRTDGTKMRCGGPSVCKRCATDKGLLEAAHSSKSADTQRSEASHPSTQRLIEAAERVVAAKDTMERVRHLDPVDDVTAVAAARAEASESVEAMRQALQEIRSGK